MTWPPVWKAPMLRLTPCASPGRPVARLKWAAPDLFTDPWNPIAGSNWAWDQANHNFTAMGYAGMMPDPYTGLELADRL